LPTTEAAASGSRTVVLEAWDTLSEKIKEALAMPGASNDDVLAGIRKMHERFAHVRTHSQLCSFFHSTANSVPRCFHSGSMIRTQPTAAPRRKQPGLTRSAKRQLGGRPAAGEKGSKKRSRNLGYNISQNVPNAKSHGVSQ